MDERKVTIHNKMKTVAPLPKAIILRKKVSICIGSDNTTI